MGTAFPTKLYGPPSAPLVLKRYESPAAERLSPTAQQANAERLLELVRTYWTIENGTHYRLDVSAGEDRCRVRHPVAATVLGILRRAVQGEYRAWARGQPRKRDRTYPTFRDRMSRRINLAVRFVTEAEIRL